MKFAAFILGLAVWASSFQALACRTHVAGYGNPLPYDEIASHLWSPERLARLRRLRFFLADQPELQRSAFHSQGKLIAWISGTIECSFPEAAILAHQLRLDFGELPSPFDSDWPSQGIAANELLSRERSTDIVWMRVDNRTWSRVSGTALEKAEQILHERSGKRWWPRAVRVDLSEKRSLEGTVLLKVYLD